MVLTMTDAQQDMLASLSFLDPSAGNWNSCR